MTAELSKPHHFTRTEIRQAEHDLANGIKKYFGEVWRIKSDGEYRGCSWECRHPIAFYAGIWRLCMAVLHKGAVRAAGRIDVCDAGHMLKFTILYEPVKENRIVQ